MTIATPEATEQSSPLLVGLAQLAFGVLGAVALAWIPLRNIDSGGDMVRGAAQTKFT